MSSKAKQCAKCGACTAVCPAYRAGERESLSARGRLHLLARLDPAEASEAFAEILSKCLLCGACRQVCSRGLDPTSEFIEARARLTRSAGRHAFLRAITRRTLATPGLLKRVGEIGLPLLRLLPAESGLRLRLGLAGNALSAPTAAQPPAPRNMAGSLSYFPGCYARHLRREIATATDEIARAGGEGLFTPSAQCCCGLAAESAGDLATARRLARTNIEAFAGSETPILTSCASCHSQLRRYPQLLAADPEWRGRAELFAGRLVEFSTFALAASGLRFAGPARSWPIFYQDPCHLRFHARVMAEPRALLRSVPNLLLRELPQGPQCCGQGGLFHLAQPELASSIRTELLKAIAATGATALLTTCTGCLLHLGAGLAEKETPLRTEHLAVFLAGLLSS